MKTRTTRDRNPEHGASGKVRVTLLIPYEIDRNIETYSMMKGRPKTDVVTQALQNFLQSEGLRSDKVAKISLSY